MEMVRPCRCAARHGFTLAEALIASSVLAVIVIAVAASISTAQKVAWESRKRMLATFAADGLLSELMTLDYYTIRKHNGEHEDLGTMQTLDGVTYPKTFWALGREVTVTDTSLIEGGTGLEISGIEVRVAVFDEDRDLSVLTSFVPEPAE